LQFSKDKYLLESPPEKLRKELEEELKLSAADIRSHGWYHGHIPREVSETLVLRNGDFLVRDSLTSVGDFVLTCRWDNEALHFRISKVLVKSSETKARIPGYSRVQYVLEADTFDSVQELVRFYVGQRKAVSQSNGVHIYCPVSRTLPLRYLEATFALACSKQGSAYSPSSPRGAHIKRRSVTMTDGLTEKMISHSPSTIHHHKEAMRNCAVSMDQIQEYRCPLSPGGEAPHSPAYSASECPGWGREGQQNTPSSFLPVTRQRTHSGGRALAVVPPSPVMRRSSDPQLSPSGPDGPPELPARPGQQSHPSESGSYCDLRACPAGPPKPPAKSYVERLRGEEGRRDGGRPDGEAWPSAPHVETASSFRPSRFESPLLPAENKPLEMSVLKRVKELLAEVDARTAATTSPWRTAGWAPGSLARGPAPRRATLICRLAVWTGGSDPGRDPGGAAADGRDLGAGAADAAARTPAEAGPAGAVHHHVHHGGRGPAGLHRQHGGEGRSAPQDHPASRRAEERPGQHVWLRGGDEGPGAAAVSVPPLPAWKGPPHAPSLGHALFQISRLEQTWVTLRQRHTEGAILYEKKLKPFLKNINDGKESGAASTASFPHIIPILSLLERGVAVGETPEPWESSEAGVDVVMYHLEAARTIAHHGGVYRSNAEAQLQGLQQRAEIYEIFQTEFQMRLLWGSRGSEGSQSERYEKFDKVLTALSHKLEPPVRHSEL
ncbi:unnamed protein product, partial [Tetraodon nigroviridis]